MQAPLIRRGLLLEYLTLSWIVVGVVIVVAAAYTARSVALAGFGLNSLIEIFASVIVVWQLLEVNQQRERWPCVASGLLSLPSRFTSWRRLR